VVAWWQQHRGFVVGTAMPTPTGGGGAASRGLEGLRGGADPRSRSRAAATRAWALVAVSAVARREDEAASASAACRVGRVRHVERARLTGPTRVEGRGGERGGDPGSSWGEIG
jgi:hypothetical protein